MRKFQFLPHSVLLSPNSFCLCEFYKHLIAMALMFPGPIFFHPTGTCVFRFDLELKPMPPINPNDLYRRATVQINHNDVSGPPGRNNCHSTAVFSVTLDDFLCPFIPLRTVGPIVSRVRVDRWTQSTLLRYMVSELRRIATYPIRSCKIIFSVNFSTTGIAANDDREEATTLNQILGEPVALASSHGLPASISAVEALKKKKFAGLKSREAKCVICQDEFSESETVSEMPCSHIFHGQCILEWLKQSHYCPLCRFEMPKDESDD